MQDESENASTEHRMHDLCFGYEPAGMGVGTASSTADVSELAWCLQDWGLKLRVLASCAGFMVQPVARNIGSQKIWLTHHSLSRLVVGATTVV